MAKATPDEIKEGIKDVFEIYKWFINLNDSYKLEDDYVYEAATVFVEQIKKGLLKKKEQLHQKMDEVWLKERIEGSFKIEAADFDHKDFWEFKKRFFNIRESLERKLKAIRSKQSWLDPKEIIDALKKLDLEEIWEKEHGEVTSALYEVLEAVSD